MRDVNDLRHALEVGSADVVIQVSPQAVVRRVRRVRWRRGALVGSALLTVAAMVVPVVLLGGNAGSGTGVVGIGAVPTPITPPSPNPTPGPSGSAGASASPKLCDESPKMTATYRWLGPLVDTGVVLDAPNLGKRFETLMGFYGTVEQPVFAIVFRDLALNCDEAWDNVGLLRATDGDLPGKYGGAGVFQFLSQQLDFGPRDVLDLGFYTRSAARVTVTSEGHESDAQTAVNAETGWTFFWVRRDAARLPDHYNTTPVPYTGPEVPTLTAYDQAGQVQHTVTGGLFVGGGVQNPRDNSPDPLPSGQSDPSPGPSQ
jgi:hypothetical protein